MNDVVRSAAFLFVPFLVFGEVIEVDVRAWADMGTGMTNGWEVSGIDRYSAGEGGYTRLNTKDDYVLSPDFTNVVTQVVMRVKCSNVGPDRFLTITPTISQIGARRQVAVPSESMIDETFTWTLSEDVRGFRLQNDTGKGTVTWAIASLTVFCTPRIVPPTGLREDALYRDAFAAAWDPASKDVRYQIQCASVTRMPPSYETVAEWNFSSLTNTHGGNPRTLDLLKKDCPGKLDDLTGMNVCMEKYTGGHVQIGQKEKLGLLGFPMPSVPDGSRPLTAILRVWKHPDDSKCPTMPIHWAAGGVTNDLATFELTVDKREYRFPIPKDVAIESVILSSTTNLLTQKESHGRVRIESFAIVSGYVPGSVTTNEFKTMKSRATAKVVKDLAPGEWLWAARSFDAEGRYSPWSPFRTVILDLEMPCYPRPGFSISIR